MSIKLVRRHGSDNWYIRGSLCGVKVDESTGIAERSKAEAIRARREWEIIKGNEPGERRVASTFLDAALSYLEAEKEGRFVQPLLDHFGTMPLADIGQAQVEACARNLYPGRAPATINRQVFTPVAAILKHAAVREMCSLKTFERPTQPKGRVRWLTPAEAERLIAACSKHMRPLVIFLLYTGARVGEALSLDWRNVNLSGAQVELLDTKNGDDRGVPLHPRAVVALANIKGRQGTVFRTPKGDAYPVNTGGGGQIKTGFKGACKRAKITNFSPHDCRHTWATWHYAANRDLMVLRELGGWSSVRMVERYAHVNVGNHAASMALLPAGSGDSEGTPIKSTRSKTPNMSAKQ